MTKQRRITRVRSPAISEPPDGRFSNCLMVDGVAYISGLTARGDDFEIVGGDVYAQAKIIFAKMKRIVEAAGGTMADVVKITCFVTNINERQGVWKARQEVFSGDFPTATMVQVVALADPAFRVEIEAIAHIGAGGG
jgi:2-iminobutanoate/2-iminopropanoate deaminase